MPPLPRDRLVLLLTLLLGAVDVVEPDRMRLVLEGLTGAAQLVGPSCSAAAATCCEQARRTAPGPC